MGNHRGSTHRSGPVRRRAAVARNISAILLTAIACTPPAGPAPIGVGEPFRGLVNGSGDGAIVTTVCPGPGTPGGTGRALAGQTLAATKDPAGPGNTGDNGAVFVEPNGSMQVVQLHHWDESVPFPTDVEVPCDGRGRIVFDPCFGIIGCRGGATADVVEVTFVNIAV